jgi:hypothetical protein
VLATAVEREREQQLGEQGIHVGARYERKKIMQRTFVDLVCF